MFEFKVGDSVTHPIHGNGIVEGIVTINPDSPKYSVQFSYGKYVVCHPRNLSLFSSTKKRKVAVVVFPNGFNKKDYHFKTDLDLNVGDNVVVDTANGLVVAHVVRLEEKSPVATKWVVAKIDMTAHEEHLKLDKEIEQMKKTLEERKSNVDTNALHLFMCNTDAKYAMTYAALAGMGEV